MSSRRGRDVRPYIRAMEQFANATSLLPEQIWDEPDKPDFLQYLGKATGAAMPLMWAHAEYIKLLRSAADEQVFDLIPDVAERYRNSAAPRPARSLEAQPPHPLDSARRRGCVSSPRRPLRFIGRSANGRAATDTRSNPTGLGLDFVDIEVKPGERGPIRFTFLWVQDKRWEGRDYAVEIKPAT